MSNLNEIPVPELYWSPPVAVEPGELSAELLHAVSGDQCRFYLAGAYEIHDGIPYGRFEIAVKDDGYACGVLVIDRLEEDGNGGFTMTPAVHGEPIWAEVDDDDLVMNIYRAMVNVGIVDG